MDQGRLAYFSSCLQLALLKDVCSLVIQGEHNQIRFHTSEALGGWHTFLNLDLFFLNFLKKIVYFWVQTPIPYASTHQFSSVLFSRSVVSNSLRPHESQHAMPPCSSPYPGVHSDSCPLSPWCHPAISSSVVPFSSCPQSLPALPQINHYPSFMIIASWLFTLAEIPNNYSSVLSGFEIYVNGIINPFILWPSVFIILFAPSPPRVGHNWSDSAAAAAAQTQKKHIL